MHYFYIYKNISEFEYVTQVTLFSHLLTYSSPVPMLREIRWLINFTFGVKGLLELPKI